MSINNQYKNKHPSTISTHPAVLEIGISAYYVVFAAGVNFQPWSGGKIPPRYWWCGFTLTIWCHFIHLWSCGRELTLTIWWNNPTILMLVWQSLGGKNPPMDMTSNKCITMDQPGTLSRAPSSDCCIVWLQKSQSSLSIFETQGSTTRITCNIFGNNENFKQDSWEKSLSSF